MFYSPLRYPGGKKRLAKFISGICLENNICGHYIEPYAGGASVALSLLIENKVKKITINDYDRSIYAFWYCVLYHTDRLCKSIDDVDVTIDEWHKQKAIQNRKNSVSLFKLGFSTFFLNRTNMSGIINAGPIGGMKQAGVYKIDCRFKKEELKKRIRLIASFKKFIDLYNLDALELIDVIVEKNDIASTIFYFDPPYFLKGQSLYLNSYEPDDHKHIAEKIRLKLRQYNWLVSYDNVSQINEIYNWVSNKIEFSLIHNAYKPRDGREVLFLSQNLKANTINL